MAERQHRAEPDVAVYIREIGRRKRVDLNIIFAIAYLALGRRITAHLRTSKIVNCTYVSSMVSLHLFPVCLDAVQDTVC